LEIPRCESCGKIAQYKCALDGKYVCCECAKFVPLSTQHITRKHRINFKVEILEKMQQNPKDRRMFEALEEITDCPPSKEIHLEEEWKPSENYVYGHKEYKVKTMVVYANGEHAGYLDFVFAVDPEEEMSIQFWEIAVHPKFQGTGLFSAMIKKLKQIAKENNVKRLYVSIENDNLPAFIANYVSGGKIHQVRDTHEVLKGRFGIPRRNDLIFVYELKGKSL
jgi:GNAT superfamily N-acetyltransferase